MTRTIDMNDWGYLTLREGLIAKDFNLIKGLEDDPALYTNSWALESLVVYDARQIDFYTQKLNKLPISTTRFTKYKNFSQFDPQLIGYEFFQKFRPALSAELVKAIVKPHYLCPTNVEIIAAFALNEFLAQEEFDVYHDFLNAKWDDFYANATVFELNEYPHTVDLYERVYTRQSPFRFIVAKNISKKQRTILETTTRSEVVKLLAQIDPGTTVFAEKDIPSFFKKMTEEVAPLEIKLTEKFLSNQVQRVFAYALGSIPASSTLSLKQINAVFIESVYLNISRSGNFTSTAATLEELYKVTSFMEANKDEFTLNEVFFLFQSLSNRRCYATSGTYNESVLFLGQLTQESNALELIKMIAEIAEGSNKKLPTMVQWNKALAEGTLETIIDSNITVTLVSGVDKEASVTQTLANMRNLFKK